VEQSQAKRELFTFIFVYKKSEEAKKDHLMLQIRRRRLLWIAQEELPAFDSNGRILMESPTKLLLEANGVGGIIRSLVSSDILSLVADLNPASRISHFYFYSGLNLRDDVFDIEFFGRAVRNDVTLKVYQTDPNRYLDALACNDNLTKITFKDDKTDRLFCSEIVFGAHLFAPSSAFQKLNVAEKYRIRQRKVRIFNYINQVDTQVDALFFKISLLDLAACCPKPAFYEAKDQDFELTTTSSVLKRLEVKQIV
jgi:hypothetical protein